MKYFKAKEVDLGTHVYVRHYSEEEAHKEFELFKKVHSTPEKGPLVAIHWWEGWWRFRNVPDDHEVTWYEFEPATDFYQHSASHAVLVTQLIDSLVKNSVAHTGVSNGQVDFEV